MLWTVTQEVTDRFMPMHRGTFFYSEDKCRDVSYARIILEIIGLEANLKYSTL